MRNRSEEPLPKIMKKHSPNSNKGCLEKMKAQTFEKTEHDFFLPTTIFSVF